MQRGCVCLFSCFNQSLFYPNVNRYLWPLARHVIGWRPTTSPGSSRQRTGAAHADTQVPPVSRHGQEWPRRGLRLSLVPYEEQGEADEELPRREPVHLQPQVSGHAQVCDGNQWVFQRTLSLLFIPLYYKCTCNDGHRPCRRQTRLQSHRRD